MKLGSKRKVIARIAQCLAAREAMPTASAERAPCPNRPWAKLKSRTRVMVVTRSGRSHRRHRRLGIGVEEGRRQLAVELLGRRARQLGHRRARRCPRRPAAASAHGFVPDAGQRLAEIGVGLERGGIDHHQIEDLARNIGEGEHRVGARLPFISESCGFQATTALTSGVAKAATISASEVLTVLTSVSFRPTESSARASR
jgi:hypothetical protein